MEGKRLGSRSVRAYDGAALKAGKQLGHASHDGGLNQRRAGVLIGSRPALGRGNSIERSDKDDTLNDLAVPCQSQKSIPALQQKGTPDLLHRQPAMLCPHSNTALVAQRPRLPTQPLLLSLASPLHAVIVSSSAPQTGASMISTIPALSHLSVH